MSKIVAVCPHCQKKYRVDPELIGRKTRCKQCQHRFEIVDEESADSFGLPDAQEFLTDQAFDPLAPGGEYFEDPAQSHETTQPRVPGNSSVTPRDWKKELKQSRRAAPFGSLQRILLALGVLLTLLGVAVNLVQLMGLELAEGNVGRIAGLVAGLLGAGLVAASLFKFPAAARMAGAAAAIFVFIVFAASLMKAQNQQQAGVLPTDTSTKDATARTLAEFGSPWFSTYPNWSGFETMQRVPSPADRWNRHQLRSTEFSASFLGEPEAGLQRLRVSRTNIDADRLTADVNGFDFTLLAFPFPTARGKSAKDMLNESEQAFGEIEQGKNLEFDGFPGREYRILESGKATHGRFFAVDDQIVHVKVQGPSSKVPGVLSTEFLESLQLRSNGNAADSKPPAFELTAEQTTRDRAISENVRAVESLVSEYIRTGGLMNFPANYLSISAGKDAGNRRFIVHPGKLPILGVDLIEIKSNAGSIIANIAPIYGAPTDEQSIMAREGFGLAGMEVNAGAWIKGVRLVFMKITPVGFDTSQSYRSAWYGTRSSGLPERLGGDGRPVYGFWMCRTTICKSLGLIREDN